MPKLCNTMFSTTTPRDDSDNIFHREYFHVGQCMPWHFPGHVGLSGHRNVIPFCANVLVDKATDQTEVTEPMMLLEVYGERDYSCANGADNQLVQLGSLDYSTTQSTADGTTILAILQGMFATEGMLSLDVDLVASLQDLQEGLELDPNYLVAVRFSGQRLTQWITMLGDFLDKTEFEADDVSEGQVFSYLQNLLGELEQEMILDVSLSGICDYTHSCAIITRNEHESCESTAVSHKRVLDVCETLFFEHQMLSLNDEGMISRNLYDTSDCVGPATEEKSLSNVPAVCQGVEMKFRELEKAQISQ